jgi:hypothetical protein
MDSRESRKRTRIYPENISREYIQGKENGSALPLPRKGEAAASPRKNGFHGESVDSPLDSQPPEAYSPSPPRSAPPPLPKLRGMFTPKPPEAEAEERLGSALALERDVLEWVQPESDVYRLAVAAETKETGSGVRMLMAAYEKEKLTCRQQS